MGAIVACRTTGSIWRKACTLVRALMLEMIDPYRPERHYMRGPGPRCRERHERENK
jgi:hypothetical protein